MTTASDAGMAMSRASTSRPSMSGRLISRSTTIGILVSDDLDALLACEDGGDLVGVGQHHLEGILGFKGLLTLEDLLILGIVVYEEKTGHWVL